MRDQTDSLLRPRMGASLCVVFGLTMIGAAAGMDVLVLRTGEQLTGFIQSKDASTIVINLLHSPNPSANRGNQSVDARTVVRQLRVLEPYQELLERRAQVKEGDAAALCELCGWAKKAKVDSWYVDELGVAALLAAPGDEAIAKEARKVASARRIDALEKADPRLSPALAVLRKEYLTTADVPARKALFERMRKEHKLALPQHYFERARRSRAATTGFHEDVPLRFRADQVQGVYTLSVPEDYDPLQCYPLMIGLHGGGVENGMLFGSGKDFMPFVRRPAGDRGYIIACPTAISAQWGGDNAAFIDALLLELQLTYNIDTNRTFLVGHSMGGWGAWDHGERRAEVWAGVASMASYKSWGFQALTKHHVAVFLHHSANDEKCPVSSSRIAADELKRMRAGWLDEAFQYTEFASEGHNLPENIIGDMLDFFANKVRWHGEGKKARPSAGPRSSFLDPVTPEEVQYFGRPGGE